MDAFITIGRGEVPLKAFLALWRETFALYAPPTSNAASDPMPTLAEMATLAHKLAKGHEFSVDVLCRRLRPSEQNTMLATEAFRTGASAFLEPADATSPSNRIVQGLKLTELAAKHLMELEGGAVLAAEALLNADVAEPPLQATAASASWATRLVDAVQSASYQPTYRNKPFGKQLQGWEARLNSYFWPNPSVNRSCVQGTLFDFEQRATSLMATLGQWTQNQQTAAVTLANDICTWGGVPQVSITFQQVEEVFKSAKKGVRVGNAPMNSGWTKVAAVASCALPPDQHQAIWDSRVAHSIIRHLEQMLIDQGDVRVPPALQSIGRIPGLGGSRKNAKYALDWVYGYGSWPTHFAGAELVRGIRDTLNSPHCDSSSRKDWTVRQVEMVLFMDGY
jgi:hypothetical protein